MLGFIDFYFYLMMVVVLLFMVFIMLEDWDFLCGFVCGVWLLNDYEECFEDELDVSDRNKFFFIWGYYEFWYGLMDWMFLDEKVDFN